jgi:hypothetical protein
VQYALEEGAAVSSAAMMIHSASETAPDFYANQDGHIGLKTPDRGSDGAVSLAGLMINAFYGIVQPAPYEAMLCGFL